MAKEIPLSQGLVAIVDDEDYELVTAFKWSASQQGKKTYAVRGSNKRSHYASMHRLITQAPSGTIVDHKNGDGLDNRRDNLRLCSQKENLRNRSKTSSNTTGFKGVKKHQKKWLAQIKVNYEIKYLGVFDTPAAAASAYDQAALKYFGEFARLNFPSQDDK